jgi:hypothetical protein
MTAPEPETAALPDVHRSAPYWLGRDQQWAVAQVTTSHEEALYALGEYTVFVLMWTAADFTAGLVGHCQHCFLADNRAASAFKQGNQARCPDCFGSSFEGGYRARIIRPALWTDHKSDTTLTPRGQVTSDSMSVETTAGFTLHHGDYLFRTNGSRYQSVELSGAWVHSGFAPVDDADSVGGNITQARLEDISSAAYDIPPSGPELATLLARYPTQHLAGYPTGQEVIRGPLLVR